MKRIYQTEIIDRGLSKPFEIITQESVNCDGRVLKQSKVAMYDPREEMSKYNAEDFYLENILAAGAIDGLKEVKLVQGRLMDMERLDRTIDEMSFLMDNNNFEKNED